MRDFAPYIAKIKASGADSVITGNWGSDLSLLVKAADEGGYNGKFFTYYTGVTGTPTALGSTGAGKVFQVAYAHYNMGGQIRRLGRRVQEEVQRRLLHRLDRPHPARSLSNGDGADQVDRPGQGRAWRMEGMKFKSAFGGDVEMRKSDHQLQQPLYMSVWQKTDAKYPYSPENTGMTLAPVGRVPELRVEHADQLPDEAAGRLSLAPPTRERPGARVGPFAFRSSASRIRMEFFTISMLNGLSYGLLLFMLSSGLTLIFSMMGVLNFAHASFYMLGAYIAYSIARLIGFWPALVIAPIVVGVLGALFERLCLRRVHKFGHVPELLITFGLSFVIIELVLLIWGRTAVEFPPPEVLRGPAFTLVNSSRRRPAPRLPARRRRRCARRRRGRAHRLLAVPGDARLHDAGRAGDAASRSGCC